MRIITFNLIFPLLLATYTRVDSDGIIAPMTTAIAQAFANIAFIK